MSAAPITVYVPRDSAALAVGANEVADTLQAECARRGIALNLVRNGSRGLFWLETLVEVATPRGRVAYGPVVADDVAGLLDVRQILMRFSPTVVFQEAWLGVFSPDQFSDQQIMRIQLDPRLAHRVIPGSPLSFGQSLLMVWPQFTFMVAGAIVIFTLGYISFQRQEVRA